MTKKPQPNNLMKNDFIEELRDVFNIRQVKRGISVTNSIVGALMPALEKPTTSNMLKAGLEITKTVMDNFEIWPDDFLDNTWVEPFPENFNSMVLKALKDKPYKVMRTSEEAINIHTIQVGQVKFAYMHNVRINLIERICVQSHQLDEAREIIKDELWSMLKDNNIVLRHVKNPRRRDDSNISVEVDEEFRSMESQRSKTYSAYLKRCIDAGVSRSVMLYGPPGTGKSTMARTIVDALSMKSFRIRVEDIGSLETSTIFEAINIFKPDAVILDDFDRCNSQVQLLETLEFFQRHVKLVIATVNNRNNLDEAILRPGRFDELVLIKHMDSDVVKAVLGDANAEAFEVVKDWPVAFIQEYVKRRRFMSPEEAQESTKELVKRVSRLSKYDDDDADDEGFLGAKKGVLTEDPTSTLVEILGSPRKTRKWRKNL